MRVRYGSYALALAAGAGLLAAAVRAPANNVEEIEARLRKDVTYLASDECEGRGVGTDGITKAADYIAEQFKKAGLKPGGVKGTWFQPFTMVTGAAKPKGTSSLSLKGPQGQTLELREGKDFELHFLSGPGKVEGPLAFAGHGIMAPAAKFNDFEKIDVAGKVVVLIRRVPRWNSKETPFAGAAKDAHAALQTKFANAEGRRAAAILLVNDASEEKDALDKFSVAKSTFGGAQVPVLHVKRDVADALLRSGLGRSLLEIERDTDHDLKPRGAALTGWSASAQAGLERPSIAVKNVIGVLEGAGPLKDETVVVGGHYDHLGYGGRGSMAKLPKGEKAIHYGADDNASGTSAVMELARRFAAMKGREGRKIVFMAFSAEESGLLGSRHYCEKEPLFPLKDTVAMLNLDMVGRLTPDKNTKNDRLIVEGVKTAKGFEELIEGFNKKHAFTLVKKPGNSPYSDHASFYRKQVPVIFLWTDTHKDYHRPSDTAEKINYAGMRRITDLAQEVVAHMAAKARPEYVAVAGGKDPVRPKGKGPTLGIVPEYGDEGTQGLKVTQVLADRPAAKAGLKDGDVILEIAGREVKNIAAYTSILQTLQPNVAVEIVVLRGKERLKLKVTPQ